MLRTVEKYASTFQLIPTDVVLFWNCIEKRPDNLSWTHTVESNIWIDRKIWKNTGQMLATHFYLQVEKYAFTFQLVPRDVVFFKLLKKQVMFVEFILFGAIWELIGKYWKILVNCSRLILFLSQSTGCVKDPKFHHDPYEPPSQCPSGEFYNLTRGYVKIRGDSCEGGHAKVYEPQKVI